MALQVYDNGGRLKRSEIGPTTVDTFANRPSASGLPNGARFVSSNLGGEWIVYAGAWVPIVPMRGVIASRPAAAAAGSGTRYFATDSGPGTEFISNGTTWTASGARIGGGFAGPITADGSGQGSIVVTHGLGFTPTAVVVTGDRSSASGPILVANNFTATTFGVDMTHVTGGLGSMMFSWIAIG